MLAIDLRDGQLRYRRKRDTVNILTDFSFKVERGEVVAILGASGSGKSSLLRVLTGQQRLNDGQLVALGGDPRAGLRRGRIALVSPDVVLLPWRSATSNARLPLDLLGRSRPASDQKVGALLGAMHIDHVADHRPSQLSDGQAQRLRLAQALSTSPELLLLDEPFSSSDEGLRLTLTRFVSSYISEDPDRTAVLVTHFAFEAAAMASRILVMSGPPLVIENDIRLAPATERSHEEVMTLTAKLLHELVQLAAPRRVARVHV